MACYRQDDLEKPLLQNGHANPQDEESHRHLDLPQHLSSRASESTMSSSQQSSDEEGHHAPAQPSALQRLLDSPTLATSCCVFLCFILKVVQQVRPLRLSAFACMRQAVSDAKLRLHSCTDSFMTAWLETGAHVDVRECMESGTARAA